MRGQYRSSHSTCFERQSHAPDRKPLSAETIRFWAESDVCVSLLRAARPSLKERQWWDFSRALAQWDYDKGMQVLCLSVLGRCSKPPDA